MIYSAFILFLTFSPSVFGKEVKLSEALYVPVFRDPGEISTKVGPLLVDETPVTNNEFLEFIRSNPDRKSVV